MGKKFYRSRKMTAVCTAVVDQLRALHTDRDRILDARGDPDEQKMAERLTTLSVVAVGLGFRPDPLFLAALGQFMDMICVANCPCKHCRRERRRRGMPPPPPLPAEEK